MPERPHLFNKFAPKARLGVDVWHRYPDLVQVCATQKHWTQPFEELPLTVMESRLEPAHALPHLLVSELLYLAEVTGQPGQPRLTHASSPESKKFKAAKAVLPSRLTMGSLENGRELLPEKDYNRHEAIQRLPHPSMAMAAAKASGMNEGETDNPSLFLANDVMVKVTDAKGRHKWLYKLAPEQFKDKESVFQYLLKLLKIQEKEAVQITGESSNAVFDAQQHIGVTETASITANYEGIDQSTLAAVIFGICDKRVNATTKQRFWRKYQTEVTLHGLQAESLRGWQPRAGLPMELLMKVNGGLLNDLCFFKDHITWINRGTRKLYPGEAQFEPLYQKFCQTLRGQQEYKSVIRNYLKVRTYLELAEGNVEPNQALMAAAQSVNSEFYRQLNGQSLIRGQWYDAHTMSLSNLHLWLHLAQRYKLPAHALMSRIRQ